MSTKQSKKRVLISVTILVLLILVFIFLVLSTKNKRIISKLEAISREKENTSNYSYILCNFDLKTGYKSVSKYWIKEDRFSANIINDSVSAEVYEDSNNEIYLMKRNDGSVYYSINGNSNEQLNMKCVPIKPTGTSESTYPDIKENITYIVDDKFMNTNCYLVYTNYDTKYWIEKDTGFIIGWMIENNICSVTFNFDNVTDNDMKLPDISKYK